MKNSFPKLLFLGDFFSSQKRKSHILPLVLILLLAACQPTPEEAFVIQNDQEKMLETAQKVDEIPEQTAEEALDLYERLGAPKTFQKELSGTGGRLVVEVILPDAELPIVRVEPKRLDKALLLAFADALLPANAKLVDTSVEWRTKGYYARMIERMHWGIDHWNEREGGFFDEFDSVGEAQAALEKLLMEQSLAPEKAPAREKGELSGRETGFALMATEDDIVFCSLGMHANPWDGALEVVNYCRDSFDNPNTPYKNNLPNDIPRREAEATARALIDAVGLDDFEVNAAYPDKYDAFFNRQEPCWRFIFTRSLGGVMETATNAERTEEEFAPPRGCEMIHVVVDKDGVAGLKYTYPYTVTDMVAEKTNLLPFSEIEKIFDRMILVYKNNLNDGTLDNLYQTYHITTVKLGLVNIPEKDSENGLLVPAWTFLGYEHSEDPHWGSEDGWTNGLYPFLTINAVDGSIINREG